MAATKEASIIKMRQQPQPVNQQGPRLSPLLRELNEMRKFAAEWKQVDLTGRKALYEVLAKVYGVYARAHADKTQDASSTEVRQVLDAANPDAKQSKNAHFSNMLIRYVFSNPEDKQVSEWAKAIRVVHGRKPAIAPEGFVAEVEKQKGGLSGFEEVKSKPKKAKTTAAGAVTVLALNPTVSTAEVQWADEQEGYQLFIGIRADDDTAELKPLAVDKEKADKLLVSYLVDKDRAEKAAKAEKPIDDQLLIDEATLKVAIATVEVSKAKKALAEAKLKDPSGKHPKLDDKVSKTQSMLAIAKSELGALTKK